MYSIVARSFSEDAGAWKIKAVVKDSQGESAKTSIKIPVSDPVTEKAEDWEAKFIIPPMLKLIQEQKKKIDELEQRLEALERR